MKRHHPSQSSEPTNFYDCVWQLKAPGVGTSLLDKVEALIKKSDSDLKRDNSTCQVSLAMDRRPAVLINPTESAGEGSSQCRKAGEALGRTSRPEISDRRSGKGCGEPARQGLLPSVSGVGNSSVVSLSHADQR